MDRAFAKTIFTRALAFAGTALISVAIMNSLPRVKEQRQRSFTRATMDGNLRRMRWLHFAGARVDAPGKFGHPLFLAASEGKLEVVRYLLDEGAAVNTREDWGSTPLIEATFSGQADVIKELLLRGADINASIEQSTALDIALDRKDKAVADLLRHHGGRTYSELRPGR